jgi:hypothetical protein
MIEQASNAIGDFSVPANGLDLENQSFRRGGNLTSRVVYCGPLWPSAFQKGGAT